MANEYTTLVGAMPNPKTLAWFDWYRDLIDARQDEIETAVASNSTLYFDFTSGNDTTGNGSESTPYKTIAKAQTLMASNTTYLFKRGIEWPETAGLTVNGLSRVKIGAYGSTGAPPLLHNFTVSLAASGWTYDGVGAWTRAVASEVGWIRQTTTKDKRHDYLRHMNSVAGCQGQAYSWHWAGGTLYLRMADGADDPNAYTFEYSLASSFTDGILINNSDLVLVEGLRLDGWGCRASTSIDKYAVKLTGTSVNDCRVVVRDNEAYYNGLHNMGVNQNRSKSLWLRNTVGGCSTLGTDGTPFVHYATDQTDSEAIFEGNIIRQGDIPMTTKASGFLINNNPLYAHDDGAGTKVGLLIWSNGYEKIDTSRTNWTSTSGKFTFSNLVLPGTEGDESTYRCLVINHRRDLPCKWAFNFQANVWHANHRYYGTWDASDNSPFIYNGGVSVSGGHGVNLLMYMRDNRADQGRSLLVQSANNTVKLWHCSFGIDGLGTNESPSQQFNITTPAAGATGEIRNNLFIKLGLKAITKFNNSTANAYVFNKNAGYGWRYDNTFASWDNTTNKINLLTKIEPQASTLGALQLVGAGEQLGLEYDNEKNGRPVEEGTFPTIGAIEGAPINLVRTTSFDNLDVYANVIFDDRTRRTLAVSLGSKVKADQVVAKLSSPATLNAEELAALEAAVGNATVAAIVADTIAP